MAIEQVERAVRVLRDASFEVQSTMANDQPTAESHVANRLGEELIELIDAINRFRRVPSDAHAAEVVDEVVDVRYYLHFVRQMPSDRGNSYRRHAHFVLSVATRQLGEYHRVSSKLFEDWAAIKGTLRNRGVRDKNLEFALVSRLINTPAYRK